MPDEEDLEWLHIAVFDLEDYRHQMSCQENGTSSPKLPGVQLSQTTSPQDL